MNRSRALLAWWLLLLVVWGLWLWQLDASDLTFDEAATHFVAHRPAARIITYLLNAIREHPPLYYLLIHGWMALAGESEFSLRFFSVGAALLCLPLTGWLARRIGPPLDAARGLAPAFLLAAMPGLAYYARDARMYSLGVAWTLLSAGVFVRGWLPTPAWPRRASLLALPLIHLLALFTHYYLLLPILVQPLLLLVGRRWRPLLAWCAVHGLPALALLAYVYAAPGLRDTLASFLGLFSFHLPTPFQFWRLWGKILFSPVVQVRFYLLYRLLALASIGGLLALWKKGNVGIWLLLTPLMALTLAFQVPHPPEARYLVSLIPFVALALAFPGLAPLWLRRRQWGIVAALLTVGAGYLAAAGGYDQALTFDKSHYSRTLQTIQAHARPGDGLLFYGPWQSVPFQYYNPGGLPPITSLPDHAPPQLSAAEAAQVLGSLMSQYQRLWIIPAAVSDVDPAHLGEGWLNTHAHPVWRNSDFSLYLPPLPPETPTQEAGVTFGQALRLERLAREAEPLPAGEPLRLTLYWTVLQRLQSDVQLTLSLVDANGTIWAQQESIPAAWGHPPTEWTAGEQIVDYEGLMVPQGTLPISYTLRLHVVDSSSGELLMAGQEFDVALATVTVSEPVHAPVLATLPNVGAATFCAPAGAPCLMLAGYQVASTRFQQGNPIPLTLHWLAPDTPLPDVSLRLTLAHRPFLPLARPTTVISQTLPLAARYPPSRWTAGRLVTLPTALTLPADAATGRARLTLQMLGPDGQPWPTAEGETSFALAEVTVEGRPVLRRVPCSARRVEVDFGAAVGLRGYRVEGQARPGGELHLTYYWLARAQPAEVYAVFNHLVAPDGSPIAQADGWPQQGYLPTTLWLPGDIIEDHYTLTIPADAPPGPYQLYVGLYSAASGARLEAFAGGQRLPEDRWTVPLPEGER